MKKKACLLGIFILTGLYYLTQQGNFFIYKTDMTDVLGNIYAAAGELHVEGYSADLYRYAPSLYSSIPAVLYTHFHVDVKLLMESMGVLLIFLTLFGMTWLTRSSMVTEQEGWIPLLSAVYFLFSDIGYVPLGNHWVINGSLLTPNTVGIALFVCVLAAFLTSRYLLAALLLGVTFSIHAAHAVLAALPLIVTFLAREFGQTRWIRTLSLSAVCFLIGAAPYFMSVAPSHPYVNWSPADEAKFFEYLKLSMHFHSHPSEWHPAKYITFFVFLALSWKGRTMMPPEVCKRYTILAGVYLAMSGVFFIFTEIFPVWVVGKLSPFRLFSQLTVLCVPSYFLYLRQVMISRDNIGMQVLAIWILGCTFFSIDSPPVLPCMFLLLGRPDRIWPVAVLVISALTPFLVFGLVSPETHLGPGRILSFLYFGSYLVPAAWKVWLVLFITAAVSTVLFYRRVDAARAFLAVVVLFCAAKGVYTYNKRMVGDARSMAYLDVQTWAHTNSPPDAGFIVDPELNGFRDFARRDVFVLWCDMFSARVMPVIYDQIIDRLNDLTITVEDLKRVRNSVRSVYISERFSQLNPDVFRDIRRKYPRMRYVLYQNHRASGIPMPVLYKNSHFTVCEIDTVP